MAKTAFEKPGNFLYPVPAVMVSCAGPDGKPNILTVAWAGAVCSDPPMLSISVRRERHSYELIRSTGEFVVNLTNRELTWAADFCGVRSGRDVDKFAACSLTPGRSLKIQAPTIEEAPVSLECRVTQILPLGSHDMFLAEVLCVQADDRYMDENGRFRMNDAGLVAWSHGSYRALGKTLGTFGFSVRKTGSSRKETGTAEGQTARKTHSGRMEGTAGRPEKKRTGKNEKSSLGKGDGNASGQISGRYGGRKKK